MMRIISMIKMMMIVILFSKMKVCYKFQVPVIIGVTSVKSDMFW